MKISHLLISLVIVFLGLFVYYSKNENSSTDKPIPVVAGSWDNQLTSTTSSLAAKDLEDQSKITLFATGDIMLGRSVNTKIQKSKDYAHPFRKISDLFKGSDITLVNLESPFYSPCPETDTGMVFCGDPISVEGLSLINVKVANLANNHISNYGQEGIKQTIEVLKNHNISATGTDQLSVVSVKGKKISVVGFNDIPPYPTGINKLTKESLVSQIKSAKASSDIVIVTVHWGNEYSPASSRQKEFARLAIDTGAEVVIGHHPHWDQEIESYKGKPIYYSLGNFVFDQMWSQKTREGLVAKIIFTGNEVSTHSAIPIFINNSYQPELRSNL